MSEKITRCTSEFVVRIKTQHTHTYKYQKTSQDVQALCCQYKIITHTHTIYQKASRDVQAIGHQYKNTTQIHTNVRKHHIPISENTTYQYQKTSGDVQAICVLYKNITHTQRFFISSTIIAHLM